MRIGELAARAGLAPSRIRFYERIGLLKLVNRRANGYRHYPEEALLALHLIKTAQDAGFTLDELRALLPGDMATWNHRELLAALRSKLQNIEALQLRLERSRAQLAAVIAQIEAKPQDMACADNARRVLSDLQGSGGIHN